MSNKKEILVIIESPAKARTLSKILGKGYVLKASMGHIRDLPKSQLGVDVEKDFAPKYVVPRAKSKVVKELKEAAKTASTVYLATDPDREGEAIAWHLAEVTKSNRTTYRRVVFHEITEEAILHAFKHPRSIDMNLVAAQQARRILDRLVGYKISPLLWRKVKRGLSAGRVQSVAVRIIVDRERKIQAFTPVEYWTIEADLAKKAIATKDAAFRATLVSLFDGTKLGISNEGEAKAVSTRLEEASYSVSNVKTKKISRQPAPPFITSTMQQEAWRKLRFSAKHTMAIAQQLYEGLPIGTEGSVGLITYMRTDSARVARSAVAETREFIRDKYGAEFMPPQPRSAVRTVKGAQEAHEAIRPTKTHREPSLIKSHLAADQYKLYELIWKRMVASQMSAASYNSGTVDIKAKHTRSRADYLLRASSSVQIFPGFTTLYTEGKDEDEENGKSPKLPTLDKGDILKLLGISPLQHFTQPPPRFTEATLIKMLEQWGIGRPSTYAPTLSTIQDRSYVTKTKGSFQPTDLGTLVNDQMTSHFPYIVDIEFTARLEGYLDNIANASMNWVSAMNEFYTLFAKSLERASQKMERVKLADVPTDEVCPKCGKPLVIKEGRYGKFLACTGYPECKHTKSHQIKTGALCPDCGGEIVEKVNKKRRTFYGCGNYPNCKFAINYKPLPQSCPKCGGLLTIYREKWTRCAQCGDKEKMEENGTNAGTTK